MICVIGPGAVGSLIAGYLCAAGRKPILVVRGERHQRLSACERLFIERSNGLSTLVLPPPDVMTRPDFRKASHVFICTKRAQLPEVAAQLKGKLAPHCRVLTCVNGVDAAAVVRAELPGQTVYNVAVMCNMRLLAPMRVKLTTGAQLFIENADKATLDLFRGTGMQVRPAKAGAQWGKLLINLNNAICALCQASFSELFTQPELRRAFVAAMDETTALLDRAEKPYDLPAPVSYRTYRWLLLKWPAIPLWVARHRNSLSDEAYPSMCADLAAGRETEVDYLNGAVVALARELDQPAPVNSRLVTLVQARLGQIDPPPLTPAELLRQLELT